MRLGILSALLGGALIIPPLGSAVAEGDRPYGHMLDRFESIDADGDGKITLDDIKERRAARFAEADANSDGDLSIAELEALIEKRRKEYLARRHGGLDINGDGKVSAEEFSAGGNHWFNRADVNNDGVVTREELRRIKFHHKS